MRRRARMDTERRTLGALFLGPAVLVLAALVGYPIIYTVWLSLHSADGRRFVGLRNYIDMFTADETRHAITNNVVWVVVAPTVVTVAGLILAVLSERVRMATALKTVLFMPMAISFLAAGVTFRLVYDESPDRGVLNAIIVAAHDTFSPRSPYPGARPRNGDLLTGTTDTGYRTVDPAVSGTPARLPLVGLAPDRVPRDAAPAAAATGAGLTGVVWLDFTRGGGGVANQPDLGERGLPGVTVEAWQDGRLIATTRSDVTGGFRFPGLTGGPYTIQLPANNFTQPYAGVSWLGPGLITPALIGSYIWIWAGFAMVLVSAGLSALPREALEAARVDGASEWQVFRRVTVPLVRPVLVVVLVTLIINVLKIFDLVYVLAPESSQPSANVVALQMYRVSFNRLDYGMGSALAVLLFILVLPAMLFNIRRLRRERP